MSFADSSDPVRRFPVGAEPFGDDGAVAFRLWAPKAEAGVELVIAEDGGPARTIRMQAEPEGWYAVIAEARPGQRYWFRIDSGERRLEDPASRYQPEGPSGPSAIVDSRTFEWTDDGWPGVRLEGQVLYEMHVGTFTPEGTWRAAAARLETLADLGITLIEMMPVADFPGRFGWGYDGVDLFAPCRLYGMPDDLRHFVDRAHALGIGVVLDVVYNHLGPSGNVLSELTEHWNSREHTTDWGEAVNFDGEHSEHVRAFYVANATYWITEFHMDGLRIDATQDVHDASHEHILAEIARRARAAAAPRQIVLIGENEPQDTRFLRSHEAGGFGFDALWNDDFHHAAMVRLGGRSEAYYTDYRGSPQEFVSAAKRGYLYQGQWYRWQKQRRGTPTRGLAARAFVNYLQNHDQVANSARGARCHTFTSPGELRALTALLLLAPQTPMLFQGQEFAASAPFLYFADHDEPLASLVEAGRRRFLMQFRNVADPAIQALLPDPADPATFLQCKLDHEERRRHATWFARHRDLLRLRRSQAAFAAQDGRNIDGAVLGEDVFVLRFFADDALDDRLVIVALGSDLRFDPAPEPLVAPPLGCRWSVLWSSEEPEYGGGGTAPPESEANWLIPGRAALVLAPEPRTAGKGL